jgi:hypothetical protein
MVYLSGVDIIPIVKAIEIHFNHPSSFSTAERQDALSPKAVLCASSHGARPCERQRNWGFCLQTKGEVAKFGVQKTIKRHGGVHELNEPIYETRVTSS